VFRVSGDAPEEHRDPTLINSAASFLPQRSCPSRPTLADLTTSSPHIIPRMRSLDCPRREIFRSALLSPRSQVFHPILSRLFPRSHEYALTIARYRQVRPVDGRVGTYQRGSDSPCAIRTLDNAPSSIRENGPGFPTPFHRRMERRCCALIEDHAW